MDNDWENEKYFGIKKCYLNFEINSEFNLLDAYINVCY